MAQFDVSKLNFDSNSENYGKTENGRFLMSIR